jgi:hypothetical protein
MAVSNSFKARGFIHKMAIQMSGYIWLRNNELPKLKRSMREQLEYYNSSLGIQEDSVEYFGQRLVLERWRDGMEGFMSKLGRERVALKKSVKRIEKIKKKAPFLRKHINYE